MWDVGIGYQRRWTFLFNGQTGYCEENSETIHLNVLACVSSQELLAQICYHFEVAIYVFSFLYKLLSTSVLSVYIKRFFLSFEVNFHSFSPQHLPKLTRHYHLWTNKWDSHGDFTEKLSASLRIFRSKSSFNNLKYVLF